MTCSKPIEHADGVGWGWFDPTVVDEVNDGSVCDISGESHLPAEQEGRSE